MSVTMHGGQINRHLLSAQNVIEVWQLVAVSVVRGEGMSPRVCSGQLAFAVLHDGASNGYWNDYTLMDYS